jgi:hypothetical protein
VHEPVASSAEDGAPHRTAVAGADDEQVGVELRGEAMQRPRSGVVGQRTGRKLDAGHLRLGGAEDVGRGVPGCHGVVRAEPPDPGQPGVHRRDGQAAALGEPPCERQRGLLLRTAVDADQDVHLSLQDEVGGGRDATTGSAPGHPRSYARA